MDCSAARPVPVIRDKWAEWECHDPAWGRAPAMAADTGGYGGGRRLFSSILGGLGGAVAGNWLYDQFSGRHGNVTRPRTPIRQTREPECPIRVATPSSARDDDGGGGASWDDGGGGMTPVAATGVVAAVTGVVAAAIGAVVVVAMAVEAIW